MMCPRCLLPMPPPVPVMVAVSTGCPVYTLPPIPATTLYYQALKWRCACGCEVWK